MQQFDALRDTTSGRTGMNGMKVSSEELRSLPPRPPTQPAASPKKRFVKVGRKTSDGSQQSASSTSSSSRSAEGVAIRQPSKSRIRRNTNRLSGVFLRVPSSSSGSMALTAGIRSSLSIQPRKGSVISADVLKADDPFELSNQITAPGILKIFGNDICEGAHYKSVLATTHSSAKELVKEALERYGLGKRAAESYVLCDTIGSIGSHQWKTEGFRVVGDNEKPLLLQSLWKPREGLARRFELQKRSSVEEKTSKDKDTITAGINAQARKLQKSRSRVTSTFMERTMGRNYKMWRSKSEMDLLDSDGEDRENADKENCQKDRSVSLDHTSAPSYKCLSPEQNHIQPVTVPAEEDGASQPKTETLCPPKLRGEREKEESEREETESSDDSTTQYSIHPPHDCPYLLLLQGCSPAQDFIIYLLAGQNIIFGRQSDMEDGSKPDIHLFAADLLPRHCYFHRRSTGSPTMLGPCQDATVTKNGHVLKEEVQLHPGDVIGLGQCYLFLFKDPLSLTKKEVNNPTNVPPVAAVPWMVDYTPPATTKSDPVILCNTCVSNFSDLHISSSKPPLNKSLLFLKSPKGHSLTLNYETQDEYRIVKEIIAMGSCGITDRPPLTASFLLCLCVQHSTASLHTSDLRRLLLFIASGVQSAVWAHTKDLAAAQSECLNGEMSVDENPQDLTLQEVMSGLRPLVVWMSNCLELLHFIQFQLPLILEWRIRKEQGLENVEVQDSEDIKEVENWALLELRLSCIRSASEETLAVLEEVLLLAFQQCVYYITKFLYPILPGLMDYNSVRDGPDLEVSVDGDPVQDKGGLHVPDQIQQLLEVLTEAWKLLADCRLHPDISSQLIGYLFYFINASLFNSLMERGSERGFYQWSRGVHMRSIFNFLFDWAHTAGLRELALKHTQTLMSAINLLSTPRKNLLQKSWETLRCEYPALSPVQLNHLLSLYSPASPSKHTWTPSAQDQTAAQKTDDILESFDTHHPLVLPESGYQFQLRKEVTDVSLFEQLDKLKEFISAISDSKYDAINATDEQKVGSSPTEAKLPKLDICQLVIQETSDMIPSVSNGHELQSLPLPPTPPSPSSPPSSPCVNDVSSSSVFFVSHKLKNLEVQIREMDRSSIKRSAGNSNCLPTPPNTPHFIHPVDLVRAEKWVRGESEALPWSSDVDSQDKGGLVFECLSALKGDSLKSEYSSLRRFVKINEEEEKQVVESVDDLHHDNDYELFSLELERGACGVGLALIDTRDTTFRVKGVFIRAVVPDSPAARSGKLQPGDRILAVNGVSLLGLDYQSGKDLIQSAGDRLRFLVARSEWMAKAVRAEC